MNPEDHLEEIMDCANKLVQRCIRFANEKEADTPNTRFFRLFTGYLLAIDVLTNGIKNSSAEFMDAVAKEMKADIRKDHL